MSLMSPRVVVFPNGDNTYGVLGAGKSPCSRGLVIDLRDTAAPVLRQVEVTGTPERQKVRDIFRPQLICRRAQ